MVVDLYMIRLLKKKKKKKQHFILIEFLSSQECCWSVVSSLNPQKPTNQPKKETNNNWDTINLRLLLNVYLLQVFFLQVSWNTLVWKNRTADSYFLLICLNKHGIIHMKDNKLDWWRKEVTSTYYKKGGYGWRVGGSCIWK